jgi:glycosyltransferase involved in cell wall biosynthesis
MSVSHGPPARERTSVLIVNPSADVYGSDLQMLESVRALARHRPVTVLMPAGGELVARLESAGARVELLDFPVLRRANASASAFAAMVGAMVLALPRMCRAVRRLRPAVLYVNTVTLPWWELVGFLTRTPTLCHLHEAETQDRMAVRRALILPLHLADGVIVISRAAMRAMAEASPGLERKAHLIYNGVPFPPDAPAQPVRAGRYRLAVVGRLSPRKAPHIALEVLAELVRRGHDAQLEVAGSTFPGYEDYEAELRARADQPDLAGRVTFSGYCSPIWPVLARSDFVLAPSLREPFGNAVVEAQLSLRPVVATAALGHLESIEDRETGLLVPAEDVARMADGVEQLIADPAGARALSERAAASARSRFSTERYADEIVRLVAETAGRRGSVTPGADSRPTNR